MYRMKNTLILVWRGGSKEYPLYSKEYRVDSIVSHLYYIVYTIYYGPIYTLYLLCDGQLKCTLAAILGTYKIEKKYQHSIMDVV